MAYQECRKKTGGVYGRATEKNSRPPGSRAQLRRVRQPARRGELSGGSLVGGHQREGEAKLEAGQYGQGAERRWLVPSVGYVWVLLRLDPRTGRTR